MNGDFIAPPNFSESFRKVSEGGAQYVFARDITDTGHKKYTKDLTPEQMITYQNQQHIFERSFYEVMLPQKPIKLFYDIDMCPAIENGDLLDQLINEILEITAISMKEMYNISTITNTDFAVLDLSSNVNKPTGIVSKTSLHIVLVNKVCFKTVFFFAPPNRDESLMPSQNSRARKINLLIRNGTIWCQAFPQKLDR